MKYRKLSPTGDYSFGSSQNDFYKDVPLAVGQAAQTSLLLWLEEWFLDTSVGTPYLQGILGKHSKELADTTIRDRILQVQGVVDIEDYSSDVNPDTRKMSVTMTLNTLYGVTQVQIANYSIF